MQKEVQLQDKEWLYKEVLTVPNVITLIRIIGTFSLVGYLFTFGLAPMTLFGVTSAWILPILASSIVLTDLVDGFIARKFNCQSKLGGAMDAIADKVFNWGIALSLIATGIMPLASLLLLAPTVVRDLYVAGTTTVDKIADGKRKKEKEEKKDSTDKEESLVDDFHRGDAMPPTLVGKIKMWPMSISIISGLRYGFSLTGNLLFPVFALITDGLSIVDIALVTKNAVSRKKMREEEIKKEQEEMSKKKEESKKEVKKNEKAKEYSRSQKKVIIDPYLKWMEEDPTYAPTIPSTSAYKVYVKK